jgi:hypothetical protein
MTTIHSAPTSLSHSLLPAIVTGGLAAGVLDGALAFYSFGSKVSYSIASGLLGSSAYPANGGGGAAIWLLGFALHFLIALGAAAIYSAVSTRLVFLRNHFLVGGVFCGVAVYLGMNLVVLPLSAVPFKVGPFSAEALRLGLLVHILFVGLPISTSLWFFSKRRALNGALSG